MRYRLTATHYIGDCLLEAGTEIGDGTAYAFRGADGKPLSPTPEMEPLDDEAKRLFAEYSGIPSAELVNAMVDAAPATALDLKPKK